jgi:hypothetical protein
MKVEDEWGLSSYMNFKWFVEYCIWAGGGFVATTCKRLRILHWNAFNLVQVVQTQTTTAHYRILPTLDPTFEIWFSGSTDTKPSSRILLTLDAMHVWDIIDIVIALKHPRGKLL